jgi:hypothetical protein
MFDLSTILHKPREISVLPAAEFVEIGPAKLTFIAPTHVKLRQDLAIHLFATSAASEMLSMDLPSPFLSDPRFEASYSDCLFAQYSQIR